jgi:hypothetical protein
MNILHILLIMNDCASNKTVVSMQKQMLFDTSHIPMLCLSTTSMCYTMSLFLHYEQCD